MYSFRSLILNLDEIGSDEIGFYSVNHIGSRRDGESSVINISLGYIAGVSRFD